MPRKPFTLLDKVLLAPALLVLVIGFGPPLPADWVGWAIIVLVAVTFIVLALAAVGILR